MTSEDTKLCLYKLFHNKEILVFVRDFSVPDLLQFSFTSAHTVTTTVANSSELDDSP